MIDPKLKIEHIYEEWVSSIFGTVILVFALKYGWDNLKDISWTEIGILSALGAVGIGFLFKKFTWIEKFLPTKKQE